MGTKLRSVIVVVLFCVAGACGHGGTQVAFRNAGAATSGQTSASGDPAAISICQNRGDYQLGTNLVAGYSTTAGAVLKWLNARNPPNWGTVVPDFLRNRQSTEAITICYVDGDLHVPVPPGVPTYNRAAILIDSTGAVFMQSAGYHNKTGEPDLPAARP